MYALKIFILILFAYQKLSSSHFPPLSTITFSHTCILGICWSHLFPQLSLSVSFTILLPHLPFIITFVLLFQPSTFHSPFFNGRIRGSAAYKEMKAIGVRLKVERPVER